MHDGRFHFICLRRKIIKHHSPFRAFYRKSGRSSCIFRRDLLYCCGTKCGLRCVKTMEKQKRRFGDRKDGRLLRDLDGMHFITPLIYPNRCDNEAYISESIDLTNMNAYLSAKRRRNGISLHDVPCDRGGAHQDDHAAPEDEPLHCKQELLSAKRGLRLLRREEAVCRRSCGKRWPSSTRRTTARSTPSTRIFVTRSSTVATSARWIAPPTAWTSSTKCRAGLKVPCLDPDAAGRPRLDPGQHHRDRPVLLHGRTLESRLDQAQVRLSPSDELGHLLDLLHHRREVEAPGLS